MDGGRGADGEAWQNTLPPAKEKMDVQAVRAALKVLLVVHYDPCREFLK